MGILLIGGIGLLAAGAYMIELYGANEMLVASVMLVMGAGLLLASIWMIFEEYIIKK